MPVKISTSEQYQKQINLVIEYINHHLDSEIDLNLLAKMSNFSPFHFHRIMKAFLGEPIGAFIVRMRMENAVRLLRHSELPVNEIAYRVGYATPSSLSKNFRRFYNISPTAYRKDKNFIIIKPMQMNPGLEIQAQVKQLDPTQVIYLRMRGPYMNVDYGKAWKKLVAFALEEQLFRSDAQYLCIYHDDPKVTHGSKLRTDICISIPHKTTPKGEIGVKEIDGGKYAVFLYKGPYENLNMVYDTIYGKYLPEMECSICDYPGFEKYLNDPQHTPISELMTEIYVPVQ